MKHNRILCSVIMVLVVFSLTGCADMPELSKEKENQIAEYAAGVLLKHSEEYDKKLITQKDKENEAKRANASFSPDPDATESPVPEATNSQLPESTDNGVNSNQNDTETNQANGQETDGQGTATSTPTEAIAKASLDEIYNINGVSFSYDSCSFCKEYKEASSIMKAEANETLLVMSFSVKNKTMKTRKVNLMNRQSGKNKIEYKVTADGVDYEPGISILHNGGLNYLETTLGAGKTEEAVLICRLPGKYKDASDISLNIKCGDKENTISLS